MKGVFQCEVTNILPVRCPGHRTFATAGPQCSCHTHLDQPEQWSVQSQHSVRSHSVPSIMDNIQIFTVSKKMCCLKLTYSAA